MRLDAARWLQVLTAAGVRAVTAVVWAPIFEAQVQPENFSRGLEEMDDFLGHTLWETGRLERLVEDLNYSPQRLQEVWPQRFPGVADAMPYAYNPEALAERVYGKRMGNTAPGDGFKYRGRGIPMVTGLDNYRLLQQLTALPLVDFPVLLENRAVALRCGLLWWEARVPDSAINSVERVTRAVQGGQEALLDRRKLTERVGKALA
jgi:putative chitinase